MPLGVIRWFLVSLFFMFPGTVWSCELKLLLAMDVSASVSHYEYNLQRSGLSASFRDPEIQQTILALDGGLLVAVTQWAGPDQQERSLDWTLVRNVREALAVAERIDALRNPFRRSSTAIGCGLLHAAQFLAAAPYDCRRTVVDVSSDGITNTGIATIPEADALAARGVTINALAVMVDQKHFPEGVVHWLLENVVRGPASFVITTPTYNQYPQAIRKKLLREMRPQFARN